VPSTWSDPEVCPFCEMVMESPEAGFMYHLKSNPSCENGFEQWRGKVGGDIRGAWSG
jgi:hypothetical protein